MFMTKIRIMQSENDQDPILNNLSMIQLWYKNYYQNIY